jgi:hypothetical protein
MTDEENIFQVVMEVIDLVKSLDSLFWTIYHWTEMNLAINRSVSDNF